MRRLALVLLLAAAAAWASTDYPPVAPGTELRFPRDEGSHPRYRTEWWYVTGWLDDAAGRPLGFQVTFFRSRPRVNEANPSRFLPRQLLFAHAAVSDPRSGHLLHDERAARAGFGLAQAAEGKADVMIEDWSLRRQGDTYRAWIPAQGFTLDLEFAPTQPPLLQGQGGFSRKGPRPESSSYYYSLPHLRVSGSLTREGKRVAVRGEAWFDHEWSSTLMDEEAKGWDWIGINLADGGALMVFRMRNARGGAHWAGGTLRRADGSVRTFAPDEIEWTPLRRWRSPRTGVEYPVQWQVRAGDLSVRLDPLMDDQESDSRKSTGTLYWEGAVRALSADGKVLGRGYLELTGYGSELRL